MVMEDEQMPKLETVRLDDTLLLILTSTVWSSQGESIIAMLPDNRIEA